MAFKSEAQRRWFFANKGGGSGGGSSSSPKEYAPGTDPIKTLYKQDEKKIDKAIDEGNKEIKEKGDKKQLKEIKKYHKKFKKGEDSRKRYFDEKTNDYIPSRKKIHERIINKVDNPNAIPKKGEKPEVIFIGGLTASGKTSAISKLVKHKDDKSLPDYKMYPDHIYLNSDNFKEMLPEYRGTNAGIVHEESTDIYEDAIVKYRNQKKNIMIDATLKNKKNAMKKIKEFKKHGYEIKLYGTNIPGEKSIDRATRRYLRSKRYVPLEMVGKNAEEVNKSVLELRHKADKYAIYDTDVKKGSPPKLIESTKSIKQDRMKNAFPIVKTEEEWRELGVDQSDLKGYDTKKHTKVKK